MARYKHIRHVREVSAPIEVLFYPGKHSVDQQMGKRLRRTIEKFPHHVSFAVQAAKDEDLTDEQMMRRLNSGSIR